VEHFITNYNIGHSPDAECAVLEDSIMQKGRPVTAGSKILENFISPLNATVVARLEAAGIKILGKTKMSEFGISGLFAEPGNSDYLCGAVTAVEEGVAAFALCNDYTGDIRRQAAERGLYYIHPTYGTVSRYGLIPAACSMDQIGIVCKNPGDGFRILSVIAGCDPDDGAMFPESAENPVSVMRNPEFNSGKKLRIGVPENVFARISGASASGFIGVGDSNTELVGFELEYFEVYAQVMRVLCCAEINSNLTRYDGIKFGYRAAGFRDLHELYTMSRTEALGADAKLTSIFGSMVLSQGKYTRYYDKAMRVRRLIKESLEFDKYDAIIMPASCSRPDDRLALHALPQLCGLPALAAPFSGGGFTLIADVRREDILNSAIGAIGI